MAGKADKDTIVKVEGMRELLRALSKIDKDLQADVRDASGQIANDQVNAAKNAASTPLQSLAASGLKVKRDRVPVIRVGKGMVKPGVREMDIFYGAEFGGRRRNTTQQFLEHRGTRGYFFYPTARARGKHYATLWADAVDNAFREWDFRPKG